MMDRLVDDGLTGRGFYRRLPAQLHHADES